METGFLMLVHEHLHRAAQVARHLAERGAPVVIHVDRRIGRKRFDWLKKALRNLDNVRFCERRRCDWGTFSIVEATQLAATMMLREFEHVRHVFLASGSCLPLRPVEELDAYLASRPRTDFIESVSTEDVSWTIGGLDYERFTLHFPFSWRRQRRLFDRYVKLQRRLGIRRRIPDGVVPHLGSQWWCLTRKTLSAILDDPKRPELDRYFAKVWIPDESYFQTLARRVSPDIESRSLTLSKFDFQGKPHVFYDDHLPLLRKSDCFVARKIWPHATGIYDTFLGSDEIVQSSDDPDPGRVDRLFSQANERRTKGRAGLLSQSRFPNPAWAKTYTAAPYTVLEGFDSLFEDFPLWLARRTGARVHGRLFAPERAEFVAGQSVFRGGLSDNAALRDYNPQAFLTNLVWNTQGETQAFQFGPEDRQDISWLLGADPNASVHVITAAWLVPLYHANLDMRRVRSLAAQYQRHETDHIEHLRTHSARAKVNIMTLAEFLVDPMDVLQQVCDSLAPGQSRALTAAPQLADLRGFDVFLQTLRNQGFQPRMLGHYRGAQPPRPRPPRAAPKAVR